MIGGFILGGVKSSCAFMPPLIVFCGFYLAAGFFLSPSYGSMGKPRPQKVTKPESPKKQTKCSSLNPCKVGVWNQRWEKLSKSRIIVLWWLAFSSLSSPTIYPVNEYVQLIIMKSYHYILLQPEPDQRTWENSSCHAGFMESPPPPPGLRFGRSHNDIHSGESHAWSFPCCFSCRRGNRRCGLVFAIHPSDG